MARRWIEAVQSDGQLTRELRRAESLVSVRMDQLGVRPEARGRPAVLRVDAALRGIELALRYVDRPGEELTQEADERRRLLERCRLVRHPNLERSEVRMDPDV